MKKETCDVLCEKGELTAVVIDDPKLYRKSPKLDLLMNNEVIIDPQSKESFEFENETRLRVRVHAKNNPSLITSISADFLRPLTKAAKKFLS